MIDYTSNEIKEAVKKFKAHRGQAVRRGIDFLLTFEQWYIWWQQTGHWHERGCRHYEYVMARHNDEGPYALHNIKCITHGENTRECVKSERFRKTLIYAHSGTETSIERKAKIVKGTAVPHGIPVIKPPKQPRQKKPRISAYEGLTEEEIYQRRCERAKKAALSRELNGNSPKGKPKKNKENYQGRTPWNKGMKLGPLSPEVKENVSQGLKRSYKHRNTQEGHGEME